MESSHFQEIKSRQDRILLETVGKSTNFNQEKKQCEIFFSKKDIETHHLIEVLITEAKINIFSS